MCCLTVLPTRCQAEAGRQLEEAAVANEGSPRSDGPRRGRCRRQSECGLSTGRRAVEGSDLVVFPELSVIGYPPRISWKEWLMTRVQRPLRQSQPPDMRGAPSCSAPYRGGAGQDQGGRLTSTALLAVDGRIAFWQAKTLPSYDVFDEKRHFDPGGELQLRHRGETPRITVCEDAWAGFLESGKVWTARWIRFMSLLSRKRVCS